MVFLVMVFVPRPQKPMHDVFVRKPSHEFHEYKGGKINGDPIENVHN